MFSYFWEISCKLYEFFYKFLGFKALKSLQQQLQFHFELLSKFFINTSVRQSNPEVVEQIQPVDTVEGLSSKRLLSTWPSSTGGNPKKYMSLQITTAPLISSPTSMDSNYFNISRANALEMIKAIELWCNIFKKFAYNTSILQCHSSYLKEFARRILS